MTLKMTLKTITSSGVSSSTGGTLPPPNSPILSPASQLSITGKKNIIKKAQAFIATFGSSRPDTPAETPPESPEIHAAASLHDAQHLQQLHQKLIEVQPSGSDAPDSPILNVQGGIQSKNTANKKPKEYKTFNEVWDEKACKYVLEEISNPVSDVDELDQYVFVVYRRIDKKTKEISFHIDIKSGWLREILRLILKDVRGISLKEDNLSVEQNLLYHILYDIQSYRSCSIDPLDEIRIQHIDLLSDYIKTIYDDTTKRLLSLLRNGEITYDLLWALFQPNDITYTRCFGTQKPRCFKFNFGAEKTTRGGTKYWNIEGRYLDFDGEGFGEVGIELHIAKFHGAMKIHLLKAFPLQYHPDSDEIRTELLECGRKFVSLKGTHHRHCRGIAFVMEDGAPVKVSIDSRIMIDAKFFKKINPNYSRPTVIECFDVWGFADDPAFVKIVPPATSDSIKRTYLSHDDLLICCPTVPGFSLEDKLWAEFAVADIELIHWSSLPFNALTISDDQKEVIMALAAETVGNSQGSRFDDFVAGKGRGLNLLLHGPPGVGKTLTAEAVSEHLQRPLYSISAGELHTGAGQLEAQLTRIFKIASHWNAILLLDEADVYLEQRSSHDMVRNGLVSVFLRKLEYCEGVLFLTTNRVREFDEAILSRIHVMLRYDNLSSDSRKQIWKHFLDMVRAIQGEIDVNEKEMSLLIDRKLNGRQIKNAVATARALATQEESDVCFSHLEKAVKASEKFMNEFNGTENTNSLFM